MQSRLFFKHVLISVCLLSLSLSACLQVQAGVVSTATPLSLPTESLSTAIPSPSVPPLPPSTIEVALSRMATSRSGMRPLSRHEPLSTQAMPSL